MKASCHSPQRLHRPQERSDLAVLAAFAREAGTPPRGELAIGTRVDWVNDAGVQWFDFTISEVERDASGKATRYNLEPARTSCWIKVGQVWPAGAGIPEAAGAL